MFSDTAEVGKQNNNVYRTTNCRTKETENATIDDMEEALSSIKEILFIDKAVIYGTIEVQFTD